jgi:dTDP-4-amino-4,6-dideoxygalactose transaminase
MAQLGGTTTAADCRIALSHLARPSELVQGPAIAAYERAFAEHFGMESALSFAAGRIGLYGVLRCLEVGRGDEVLLQAPTHIVVANAIRYTGAQPVFVDIDLSTYNMDVEQAATRVTPRTKAIVLQHTFGIPADVDAVLELAATHGLMLIEDCVHALGAKYRGQPIGSFGRAAFFSTEETKTMSTTMGGMLVTNDRALAQRLREFQEACAWPPASLAARYLAKLLTNHVLTEPHVHRISRAMYEAIGERHPLPRATVDEELIGLKPARYEERLSNGQAAVGLQQLMQLESNLAHRHRISELYAELFAKRGLRGATIPDGAEPAYARYPVWVEDRPKVERLLGPLAVPGTWFTSVLEEAVSPHYGGYVDGSCPRAELAASHLYNLPTHPRVRPEDAVVLVDALAAAENSNRS